MQGWIVGDLRLGTHFRYPLNASVQSKMNGLTHVNTGPRSGLHKSCSHLVTVRENRPETKTLV